MSAKISTAQKMSASYKEKKKILNFISVINAWPPPPENTHTQTYFEVSQIGNRNTGDEFLTFDTAANKRDDVKRFKTVSVKRYIRQ